jgi:hypothetical protein
MVEQGFYGMDQRRQGASAFPRSLPAPSTSRSRIYDLRLPEVREAQTDLARQYGIYGFCYYHYWFNGQRILERPFNEVLASGKPDFPFCLCWANHSWNTIWDGTDNTLIEQTYPGHLLEITVHGIELAKDLVAAGIVPSKASEDALHISIATVHFTDYLLTWNCRHIANPEIQARISENFRLKGLFLPFICTPDELLGDTDE